MFEIKIRTAVFTDIDSVIKIEQESISSWTYNQFIQELDNKFSLFLVAEYDESLIGYIIVWKVADEIQLNSIAVKKEFRKKGIGTRLLNFLFNDLSAEPFRSVFLEVRSKNTEAITFYEDNGFTKSGVRKKYYIDDDAFLMEKKL